VSARRTERLANQIREELAGMIRGLKDPRIGFVTITRVALAEDLRYARVSFGVLGDKPQREKTAAGLRQASGFLRRELGRRLRVRYTPELQFEYDEGLDATDRVAKLLEEIKPAAGSAAAGDATDSEDE
jgi:ribosome-binding factor A